MKQIFTLSLLFFFSTSLYSQKCKPKVIDTDKFTEQTTEYWGSQLTSMSVLSFNIQYVPSMFVYKDNGENKILITIDVSGKLSDDLLLNNHEWFEKGSTFYIKLENEILEFSVEKSKVNQAGYTSAELISTITKEQIEKINTQKIERGKVLPFIDSEDMYFQFKVANGRDKKMKEQLSCFLQQ